MTYKDLLDLAWHSGQLNKSHPMFNYEDKLLSVLSGTVGERAKHDQEHRDMLNHWNIPFNDEVTFELSHIDGKPNRVWHMMLHFKYWNEKNINEELLKQLNEDYPEVNLDDVPLPRVTGEG